MSLYALQKAIRDVNRKPACREALFFTAVLEEGKRHRARIRVRHTVQNWVAEFFAVDARAAA
jgi:hypothetical protein